MQAFDITMTSDEVLIMRKECFCGFDLFLALLSTSVRTGPPGWGAWKMPYILKLSDNPLSSTAPFRTFDPKVYAIYSTFPIGVMKADFFRYAVLLAHGGIYADVDTACQVG